MRDVVKLCPGEESQARRRHDCLTSKMNQLSPECRQAVERQQNEDSAQTEICQEDYKIFCPGSKKFGLNDCMYEHYGKDKLSPKCKKIISLRYRSLLSEFPEVKP